MNIGDKIKLKEIPYSFRNETYYDYVIDDTEFLLKTKLRYGNKVRYIVPFTSMTMDWDPDRTNIFIDSDGTITEISQG